MGQLFMKKYPEMAIVTSDLIQNGKYHSSLKFKNLKKIRNSPGRRNECPVDV